MPEPRKTYSQTLSRLTQTHKPGTVLAAIINSAVRKKKRKEGEKNELLSWVNSWEAMATNVWVFYCRDQSHLGNPLTALCRPRGIGNLIWPPVCNRRGTAFKI